LTTTHQGGPRRWRTHLRGYHIVPGTQAGVPALVLTAAPLNVGPPDSETGKIVIAAPCRFRRRSFDV